MTLTEGVVRSCLPLTSSVDFIRFLVSFHYTRNAVLKFLNALRFTSNNNGIFFTEEKWHTKQSEESPHKHTWQLKASKTLTNSIKRMLPFILACTAYCATAQDSMHVIKLFVNSQSANPDIYGQVMDTHGLEQNTIFNINELNSLFERQPFQLIKKVPANVLLRLIINNTDSVAVTLMINPLNNQIDNIRLYQRVNNHLQLKYTTGYKHPFTTRPIQSGSFYLPVVVDAGGTKEILLQLINTDQRAFTRIKLLSSSEAFLIQGQRNLMVAFFIGIIFLAFLYNLMLFVAHRKRIYISYCLYVFFTSLYMLYDDGLIFQYIFPDYPVMNENLYYTSSLLSTAFSILFITTFISQDRPYNLAEKGMLALMGYILLLVLAIPLLKPLENQLLQEFQMQQLLFYTITLTSTLLGLYLIQELKKGNRYAQIYSLASMMLVVAVVYLLLNFYEIIDNKTMRINLLYLGILTEIVFLSSFFAWQYNRLNTDKLQLQQQLIDTEKQNFNQVLNAQENERKRIAQDLHDGVGGFLGALRLFINARIHQYKQTPSTSEIANNLQTIQEKLDTAITDIRHISHNLMPKDFEQTSLKQLIESHINSLNQQPQPVFSLIADDQVNKLNTQVRIHVYRIITELTNNIVRHSEASRASIQCLVHDQTLLIQAEDDGKGFSTANNGNGIGLKNIQSRVIYLKGQLKIETNPFNTQFIIEIPLNEEGLEQQSTGASQILP